MPGLAHFFKKIALISRRSRESVFCKTNPVLSMSHSYPRIVRPHQSYGSSSFTRLGPWRRWVPLRVPKFSKFSSPQIWFNFVSHRRRRRRNDVKLKHKNSPILTFFLSFGTVLKIKEVKNCWPKWARERERERDQISAWGLTLESFKSKCKCVWMGRWVGEAEDETD